MSGAWRTSGDRKLQAHRSTDTLTCQVTSGKAGGLICEPLKAVGAHAGVILMDADERGQRPMGRLGCPCGPARSTGLSSEPALRQARMCNRRDILRARRVCRGTGTEDSLQDAPSTFAHGIPPSSSPRSSAFIRVPFHISSTP